MSVGVEDAQHGQRLEKHLGITMVGVAGAAKRCIRMGDEGADADHVKDRNGGTEEYYPRVPPGSRREPDHKATARPGSPRVFR